MRTSGILMPVFSLPAKYGIGDMGPKAYEFVDFLCKAGQSYWQILPLNPTNYGDSPYQSFSTFAGNPYFISPEFLIRDGLLTEAELNQYDFGQQNPVKIDYGKMYIERNRMLKDAYKRFVPNKAYEDFCKENAWWLDNYALFMTLKNMHEDQSWTTWEQEYQNCDEEALKKVLDDHPDLYAYYHFAQYEFFTQWLKLKEYANHKGIKIIGDIPIYVAYDSADVWASKDLFLLGEDFKPIKVSGCPPDAFSEDGQLWGNPLYRWDKMQQADEPFAWWKKRIHMALTIYDIVRIDHFRGFEAYYTIPFGDQNAKNGVWQKGPGMDLFREVEKELGEDLPIIAEDLGYLTKEVRQLLKDTGFPGMKVLQFAFSPTEENEYLPHNIPKHCIVYTGTHDNDTIIGWLSSAAPHEVAYAKEYLHATSSEGFNWTMMRSAMMSQAETCILMMQDFLGLDGTARINIPSTLGINWQWRILDGCTNDWLARIIHDFTKTYWRLPGQSKPKETD